MTLARKRRRYWTCPKCGHRNEHRTSSRKCQGCNEQTKPAKRVRKHAATLQRDSYEVYELLSVAIHGGEAGACGVCGKPPSERRRNDRDHCHRTGRPRGLACPGDTGCNVKMAPWVTQTVALVTAAEERRLGHEREAVRWTQIAAYLGRVDAYYQGWGDA